MLYWLADFSSTIGVFNVFRYLTVRTGGAMFTAAMFVFLFGPWIIDHLRLRQGKGAPADRGGGAAPLPTTLCRQPPRRRPRQSAPPAAAGGPPPPPPPHQGPPPAGGRLNHPLGWAGPC